jgi:NADH-quinone oxidoreductase subunit L
MMVPVAILAVLSVIGGFIETRALGVGPSTVSDFVGKVVGAPGWEDSTVAVVVGLVTMLLGAALFVGAMRMRPWSSYVPWAQTLLERKYYFDEAYDRAFVRPMDGAAGFALRDVEQPVLDGVVVGTGRLTEWSAGEFALTQSGYFRNYVLVFTVGAVAVAGVLLLVRAFS